MIPYLIGSTRVTIQLVVFYLLMLAAGIQLGLKASGPFDYLNIQFQMTEARAEVLGAVAPSTDRVAFVDQMANTMMDAAMRGVTLGYNAPEWVTSEIVFAVAGYLILGALVVATRAWRYTTTTHIN